MASFWDRISGLYDLAEQTNHRAVSEMIALAAEAVPPGAELLECAAGTGVISLAAAKRADRILCTDQSAAMLDKARKKAERQGAANISFAVRDLFHLPDPDGRYGAVCAANVLHLLDRPDIAAAELLRVTAPGGVLILPTFLMAEARPGLRFLISLYRLLGFRQKAQFDRKSYQAFLEGLALAPVKLTVTGGRLPVGVAVLQKPTVPEEST